jgi:hypothetical protein
MDHFVVHSCRTSTAGRILTCRQCSVLSTYNLQYQVSDYHNPLWYPCFNAIVAQFKAAAKLVPPPQRRCALEGNHTRLQCPSTIVKHNHREPTLNSRVLLQVLRYKGMVGSAQFVEWCPAQRSALVKHEHHMQATVLLRTALQLGVNVLEQLARTGSDIFNEGIYEQYGQRVPLRGLQKILFDSYRLVQTHGCALRG